MIFCTKCGLPHQEDDNFCKNCGNLLSQTSDTNGKKIISIPRHLAKRCLMENLDFLRTHQEWWKKTHGILNFGAYNPKYVVWIQFDPATGICARLPVTRIFDDPMSGIAISEDLSQLKRGWRYFRIFTPTKEWEVDAYLDSPPGLELTDGDYKGRFD